MRRLSALLLPLACAAALAGCSQRTTTTESGNANATNANASPGAAANAGGANANAANSNGSREGVGPHGQGIGGTSEVNRNSAVAGNSNVEPTGVNRNVGATPAANRNR